MNRETRIVHEAASQRQHVRLKTPAKAEIDGEYFDVKDWSVAGVQIKGFGREVSIDDTFPITLHLPFQGFEFAIQATLRVRHYDPSTKVLGGSFTELQPQQLSLLHYVTDAYLSGEVVNAGDVLQVVGRDNSARARASDMPQVERSRAGAVLFALRRNIGLTVILIIALLLILYIGMNLYTRTFTVSGDGAITSPQGTVLRTPGSGAVIGYAVSPGQRVRPGTRLASLQREDGTVRNMVSDCDCVVGERLAEIGAPLYKSAAVLSLAPFDGTTQATLVVRLKEIRKVKVGNRVAINFFNDDLTAMGSVERVNLPGLTDPATLEQDGLNVPDLAGSVLVRFDDSISTSRIGQPVSGRIRIYNALP